MLPFSNILILGGGLLGGSLALALQGRAAVTLWARRDETVAEAKALKISATSDLTDAVKNADLAILCVPVGAMENLLEQAIAAGLPKHCLITDVGSVKQFPHHALGTLTKKHGMNFIGSHPMAGGEKGGIEMSQANLFHNAACLLTNDENISSTLCDSLENFWKELGCRTHWVDAKNHDSLVARISHFPHLIASLTTLVALENVSDGEFGGGGLRDTTRVASGNPDMWAEIVLQNKEEIIPILKNAANELSELLAFCQNENKKNLRDWLSQAKQKRDSL